MQVKKIQTMEVLKQLEGMALIFDIRMSEDNISFIDPDGYDIYHIYFDRNDNMIPYNIGQKINKIEYLEDQIKEQEEMIKQIKEEIAEWVD